MIDTLNAHQRLATKSIFVSAGMKWIGRKRMQKPGDNGKDGLLAPAGPRAKEKPRFNGIVSVPGDNTGP
jgi:hypothetical protein